MGLLRVPAPFDTTHAPILQRRLHDKKVEVPMIDTQPPRGPRSLTSWLRDERVLQVLLQLIFVAVVATAALYLFQNMSAALSKQGMVLGFAFLNRTSGFDIAFKLINHVRSDSNLHAIIIGVLNTILVAILSIIISTVFGILVGIARISNNFLVNRLAWAYIEIFRNIPLMLVIIFSYSIFVYNLPLVSKAFALPGNIYLSNRGVNMPSPVSTSMTVPFLIILAVGLVISSIIAAAIARRQHYDNFIRFLIALGILLAIALLAWLALPAAPITWDIPVKKGLNYTGGFVLPPEFSALVMGLVLGSSPFTADTVRAGIQQVSKGQIEAARALGMSGYQTMRFIIFPQAMRVIVPPMTSNFLSLTKNTSLASVISFPEIVHISSTITTQTGRAVEIMSLVMGIYLTLSLFTSAFMNWYNNKVKIVER
jgi:general L-amino acid transport system permease protein